MTATHQPNQQTTMDNTQTTEQTTEQAIDPQLADVGTTGEAIPSGEESSPISAETLGTMNQGIAPVADTRFVIPPAIGRKVHFYPNGSNFHSTPLCIDPSQPMDADVVYVWGDRMVNLNVRDHIGQVHAFTSVTLRQPDDEKPLAGAYAEWMPFQAAQARAAA